jgi:hypothetical protein
MSREAGRDMGAFGREREPASRPGQRRLGRLRWVGSERFGFSNAPGCVALLLCRYAAMHPSLARSGLVLSLGKRQSLAAFLVAAQQRLRRIYWAGNPGTLPLNSSIPLSPNMQYDKDNNKQNNQLEADGYEVLSSDKDQREGTAETMASAAGAAPDALAEGLANVRIESREQTVQPDEVANDEAANDEESSDSEIEWVQVTVPVYKHRRHGGRGGRHHRGPPGFGPMGLGPMPPFHPWTQHGMGRSHGKHGNGRGSRHNRAQSPSGFKSGGGRRGKGCRGGRHSDKNDKDDFQIVTDEESSGNELPPAEGEVPFPPPSPGHHGRGHRHRGPPAPGAFPFDFDSMPFPFPPHFGGHGMGRGRGGFGGFGGFGGLGGRAHQGPHGHYHGHHHGPGFPRGMPSFGLGHPHAFGSHTEEFPEFFGHGHAGFGGRGRHHHFHGFMGPFGHRGGPAAVPQDEVPE